MNKICLGTAQFGLDYGIANKKGKISKEEVFEILDYAYNKGIMTLDTAHSYGESEERIGEFISESKNTYNIISKLPPLDNSELNVESYYLETLQRLRQEKIYGYLIHRFDDLTSYKGNLWIELRSLKERGLLNKAGTSLYKTEELRYLLDNNIAFDIIQVPYNIFDQRFHQYFPALKKKDVKIFARSIFLQGLFFAEDDIIEKYFASSKKMIELLRNISKEHDIPANAIYLCFALLNPFIDKVIIGVDSLSQLKENIDSLAYIKKVEGIYQMLESLKFYDENVILPFNWKR